MHNTIQEFNCFDITLLDCLVFCFAFSESRMCLIEFLFENFLLACLSESWDVTACFDERCGHSLNFHGEIAESSFHLRFQ